MPDPSRSATPSRTSNSAGRSVLSADLRIKGDITSDGAVEIMGEVEGKITTHSLVIGADGNVKGSISAEAVEVRGTMEGRISCSSLTLRATSNVKADSTYTELVIESGAIVEGRFTHASMAYEKPAQASVLADTSTDEPDGGKEYVKPARATGAATPSE